MNDLKAVHKSRFLFLEKIYIEGLANTNLIFDEAEIHSMADAVGIERDSLEPLVQYLVDEGLLELFSMDGDLKITHAGIKEVEKARLNPERPTVHFPAIQNILHIQNASNNQIQQGTHGSTQSQVIENDAVKELLTLVAQIKNDFGKHPPPEDVRSDVEAHILTIEAQTRAKKPLATVISSALHALKDFAIICSADVAAHGITQFLATHRFLNF
jgi:hypothetical protein